MKTTIETKKRGRKKIKMDFFDFIHFLDRNNNSYYDCYSVKFTKKEKVIRGMLYKLTKPLSDEDKEYLLKWKNIDLYIVSPEYAREIKNNAVIIFNNCIR